MSGHTPGPWALRKGGGFEDATGRRVEHSSCWIEGAWGGGDGTDRSLANDRLISAAPEMLEALERIVDSVARTSSGDVCQTDDFDAARSAIAKAKGETT